MHLIKRPLLVVLPAVLVLSLVWHYLEFENRQYLEKTITDNQTRIASLRERLTQQKNAYQELAENFDRVQEDRLISETQLQELIDMEWEKKYEAARLENESLLQENAGVKRQHEIEISRLERARNFLATENNNLKVTTVKQAEVNEDLMESINRLETENKQFKKTIAKLESIPEKLPGIKPKTAEPASVPTTRTDKNNESDVYRHVRLQSLNRAMLNQDSADRRKILISVIPTIPSGVSGSEFLSLIKGMQSEDILAAIQMTHQYLIRPLDNQIVGELVANMNEKDAESAGIILYSGEK